MEKLLLAKAHVANLNKLTESEVTELTIATVNETAVAILKSQESCGITIVSLQRNIQFVIQFNPYCSKWQTKLWKMAPKDFETSEYHQDMWYGYLMLGFVSAYIPWNAVSNLELEQSDKVLCNDLVLQSATTLTNICWRQHPVTVNAIKKQLLSWNVVRLAWDGWTSMNKVAITLVIAYYMDRNGPLSEVQLALDKVECLLFSCFES